MTSIEQVGRGRVAARPPLPRSPASRGRVLLVEDDDGDAFLVEELLAEAGAPLDLVRARSVREALALVPTVSCVLLDLGLPDTAGLSGLRALREVAPTTAVIVLTGLVEEHRGVDAVAAGAEDYLVKGGIPGGALLRAVRYAVERRRNEETTLALRESELRSQENARLERGLLPRPLLTDRTLAHSSRYRPGRAQALLGGDFYDMVQSPDGTVDVLLGDVCGHGPDEAAIGVSLRIAWRTLVLAGVPEPRRLAALQQVLVTERESEELFATTCTLTVRPDRRQLSLRLAGHPPPVLLLPELRVLPGDDPGPAIGVLDVAPDCPLVDVALPERWALLLATDGLLEGRDGSEGEPLGWEGVLPEVADLLRAHPLAALPDALIDRVERRHGGSLTDDVALLVLDRDPER